MKKIKAETDAAIETQNWMRKDIPGPVTLGNGRDKNGPCDTVDKSPSVQDFRGQVYDARRGKQNADKNNYHYILRYRWNPPFVGYGQAKTE